jgi:MFS transporter, DHA1 family, multidrug resistance protein
VPDPSRRRYIVVLGMLSTFGPISLDLYLPALPQLAEDLNANPSGAQLTITACLLGLATGQLVAGPLSDRFGRRRPLIIGLIIYIIASLTCALAPTIEALLLLRLLQGLAGAAGLVIARAVARDLYSGNELLIFFSRLILISGLAPVIAPVLGGQLNRVMDWRGMFGVLACFGFVLLLAGVFGVPETLPPDRRRSGGLSETLHGFRELLTDRLFVGSALSSGLAGASMFAYIAGATFVLQQIYGLSPQGFSLVFGVNSLGIMGMGQLAGRLATSWRPIRLLAVGLGLNLLGAVGVAVSTIGGLPLPILMGSLFVMVSAVGMIFPTATTLALSDYPHQAGGASSLLGLGQYVAGAVAAPLVGIAGEQNAAPLGVVTLTASLAAMAVFQTLVAPALRRRGDDGIAR